MPLDRARLPLNFKGLRHLPDGPAVYVLWHHDRPVLVGTVLRGPIREQLLAHVASVNWETPATPATHFSFELSDIPNKRAFDISIQIDEQYRGGSGTPSD